MAAIDGHESVATAIVLISTKPGFENRISTALCEMSEVVESMVLFGEYDAYCKIVMPDFTSLSTFILNNIRTIDGVISTTTLTAATNQ
ncbi:MAG: Lrp/AsnC family transcriptional regulator [Euryarchaeota archaeon TMED117]|jgi:DNA-binding Lrp family transcriptional regulator|nr:MAG: Lrp/AsnC family transcriptional regulator [Euryarchaeota archaeon TMED117]|tara:strand:+ start:992 stop:1255 length:264 start_codon:yes stop_codon:yes gene_type:complete